MSGLATPRFNGQKAFTVPVTSGGLQGGDEAGADRVGTRSDESGWFVDMLDGLLSSSTGCASNASASVSFSSACASSTEPRSQAFRSVSPMGIMLRSSCGSDPSFGSGCACGALALVCVGDQAAPLAQKALGRSLMSKSENFIVQNDFSTPI